MTTRRLTMSGLEGRGILPITMTTTVSTRLGVHVCSASYASPQSLSQCRSEELGSRSLKTVQTPDSVTDRLLDVRKLAELP